MIKRIDPNATIKLVSVTDEAIDSEKSDLKSYAGTLDLKHIVVKDGLQPTYFVVGNISNKDQSTIKNEHSRLIAPSIDKEGKQVHGRMVNLDEAGMYVKYFDKGVKKLIEDGKDVSVSIDEIPFMVIQEVGSYVWLRTIVGDRLKKD